VATVMTFSITLRGGVVLLVKMIERQLIGKHVL